MEPDPTHEVMKMIKVHIFSFAKCIQYTVFNSCHKPMKKYYYCPIYHVRKLRHIGGEICSTGKWLGVKPSLSGSLTHPLSIKAFNLFFLLLLFLSLWNILFIVLMLFPHALLLTAAIRMFQTAGQVCWVTLGGIWPTDGPTLFFYSCVVSWRPR